MDKFQKIIKNLPAIYNPTTSNFIKGLMEAIAESDSNIELQLEQTNNQIFVTLAEGRYLGMLGDSVGVPKYKPRVLSINDNDYRKVIPALSYFPKQVRSTIYELLDAFWGSLYSRPNLTCNTGETYNLNGYININSDVQFATNNNEAKILDGSNPDFGQILIGDYIKPTGTADDNFIRVSKITTTDEIWSASSSLNEQREYLAGCGVQNAALSFGGFNGGHYNTTEKFNGSTWSTTGNLNTARSFLAGCGTQSAALSFGGSTRSVSTVTEKFNGSTWSISGDLNTARDGLAGCGTQDAALSFGGIIGSSSTITEKFNGSTWSNSNNLNIARYSLAGCGTQDAALSFGGRNDLIVDSTEKFNGSTWSTSWHLNTARYQLTGCGTQSFALSFGGVNETNILGTTEKFNGVIWFISNALSSLYNEGPASCGSQNSALGFSTVTEKFNYLFDKIVFTTNYEGQTFNKTIEIYKPKKLFITTEKGQETLIMTPNLFSFASAVTAQEIINAINNNLKNVIAEIYYNPGDKLNYINIRTKSTGLNSYIQITGGNLNDKLNFSTEQVTIDNKNFIPYPIQVFEINHREIVIKIPYSVPSVRRTLKGAIHFQSNYQGEIVSIESSTQLKVNFVESVLENEHAGQKFSQGQHEFIITSHTSGKDDVIINFSEDISSVEINKNFFIIDILNDTKYVGSYLYDDTASFYLINQNTILDQTISADSILTSIKVNDASDIPDAPGYITINYGADNAEGPIKYRNRPNNSTLLIDPTYEFKYDHIIGETISVTINQKFTPKINGDDYLIYVVDDEGARLAIQELIQKIIACGVIVRFIVQEPIYLYERC